MGFGVQGMRGDVGGYGGQWGAREEYHRAREQEWAMGQLGDMFPNYDSDVLAAIYSANAGDLERTIAALLSMNIA